MIGREILHFPDDEDGLYQTIYDPPFGESGSMDELMDLEIVTNEALPTGVMLVIGSNGDAQVIQMDKSKDVMDHIDAKMEVTIVGSMYHMSEIFSDLQEIARNYDVEVTMNSLEGPYDDD